MKTYQDFCNNITNELFRIIDEKGNLLTWRKGWDDSFSNQLPISANGHYHGGNLFTLLLQQENHRFPSNRWLTMKQINKLGGKVEKGAKSQQVYFWKIVNIVDKEDSEASVKKPFFRQYRVFNLDQTNLDQVANDDSRLITSIDVLLKKHEVSLSHFGGLAYFNAGSDDIVLPKQHKFTSDENYYATLLHELTHWTGHPSRLNRQTLVDYSTDDTIRAEEELVAEIGALLLTTHFNIKGEIENHASYVNSWKQLLTPKQVMNAAAKAAKAFSYLIEEN